MPGPDDDVDDAIGSIEESPPPPEAASANGAPPAGPGRNPNSGGGRQRRSVGSTAGLGQGIAASAKVDDPNAPFPAEAMDAANEIARRIAKFPGLGHLDNLEAHIFPEDGSSPRRLARIRFTELAGHPQLSPGAMLEKLVTDRVHRPLGATTDKTYNVSFHWMKSGEWLTRNTKIYLGSAGEIERLEAASRPQALPPYNPAPAYGQAPVGYGAPPAYAPPAPQAPQVSPENQAMWDRLQRTEGALSEVLDFLKSQRNAPAGLGAQAAAPAPAASPHAAAAEGLAGIAEVVAQSVARTLVSMGVAKAPEAPPSPNAGAGAPSPRPRSYPAIRSSPSSRPWSGGSSVRA